MRVKTGSLLAAASALIAALAMGQDNWTQFRGPNSTGVAQVARLPLRWSATENVVWKTEIPGKGWSSPVVWHGRIIVTSAVGESEAVAPRTGLYIQNMQGRLGEGEFRFVVYCLDWQTGKILWEKTAYQGRPKVAIHAKNSYASATPVADGEQVVACFGTAGLFCYGLDGQEIWSHRWEGFRMRSGWGPASSPIIHEGRVYTVNDNETGSFLLALDMLSGKPIWKVARDEKSNWSTPVIWKNGLRTEIVTTGSNKVRSYDLDGRVLWELGGMSSIHIPSPVATKELLYVSSGYVIDQFRPVYAIRPGAAGDISLPGDQSSSKYVAFCLPLAGSYAPSPLVYGDYLYLLYDRGSLACYDAHTGNEIYGRKRLSPDRATFAASPWAGDGKVYCLSEDGETFVVQAGREFKVLQRNRLSDVALASPAVAHDNLVIRTFRSVYRIGPR